MRDLRLLPPCAWRFNSSEILSSDSDWYSYRRFEGRQCLHLYGKLDKEEMLLFVGKQKQSKFKTLQKTWIFNAKVHSRVHKNPPIVIIITFVNLVQSLPSYLFKIQLIYLRHTLRFSSHFKLGFQICYFLQVFPQQICVNFLPCVLHAPTLSFAFIR
jgi:hypothetical protein